MKTSPHLSEKRVLISRYVKCAEKLKLVVLEVLKQLDDLSRSSWPE